MLVTWLTIERNVENHRTPVQERLRLLHPTVRPGNRVMEESAKYRRMWTSCHRHYVRTHTENSQNICCLYRLYSAVITVSNTLSLSYDGLCFLNPHTHTSDHIHVLPGDLISIKLLEIVDALLSLPFACLHKRLLVSLTHPKIVAEQYAPHVRPRVCSHPPSFAADGSALSLSYGAKLVRFHCASSDARVPAVLAPQIPHYLPPQYW